MSYNGETLQNPGKYNVKRGPTVLYKRSVISGSKTALPLYMPFEIDDSKMLITIRDALIGDERARESSAYQRTHVRFGWIESNFNSLNWIKLSDLVDGHYNNNLTASEKRKLMEVCKLLFISIKSVPRCQSDKERKTHEKIKAMKIA